MTAALTVVLSSSSFDSFASPLGSAPPSLRREGTDRLARIPSAAIAVQADTLPQTSSFVASSPTRLADTREAECGCLPVNTGTIRVVVAGRGGVPPSATTAQLTVTVTDISAAMHVTVWPSGQQRPTTSVANATPSDGAIANTLPVMLGIDGAVDIAVSRAASVVVDVAGAWVPTDAATTGGRYRPITPTYVTMQLRAGEATPVSMPSAVSRSGAVTAVAASFDVEVATGAGFLASWPTGSPWPGTSLLNHRGAVRRNSAIVATGPDGSLQVLSSTDAVVTIGVFGAMVDAVGPQGLFVPAPPTRVVDTRVDRGLPWATTGLVPASASTIRHRVGRGGDVAVVNLTTVGGVAGRLSTTDGTVIHRRDGEDARAAAAYVSVAPDGTVGYLLEGRTHVIADLVGTFTGGPEGTVGGAAPAPDVVVLPARPWAPAKRWGTACEERLLAHLDRHMPLHLRWVLPYVEIRVSPAIPAPGIAAFANYSFLHPRGYEVPLVGKVSGPMTTLVVDAACEGRGSEAYVATHEAVGHLIDSLFDDIDGWPRAGGRPTGLSFNGVSPMMPVFQTTSARRAVELFADCVTAVLGTMSRPFYTSCSDPAWLAQTATVVSSDVLRLRAAPLSCTVHTVLAATTAFETTLLGTRIARGDAPASVPAGSSISTCTVAVFTPFGALWGTTDRVVILATPDGSLYRPVMTGAMARYG